MPVRVRPPDDVEVAQREANNPHVKRLKTHINTHVQGEGVCTRAHTHADTHTTYHKNLQFLWSPAVSAVVSKAACCGGDQVQMGSLSVRQTRLASAL